MGTWATATMRSSVRWSKTRAPMTAWIRLEGPGDVLDGLTPVEADLVRRG